MHADQLLENHIAQVDQAICEGAVQMAQRLLAAGASVDDLRPLMQPFIRKLAQCRAEAVAKLRANANRLRVIEAQIERNEAQLERSTAVRLVRRLEQEVAQSPRRPARASTAVPGLSARAAHQARHGRAPCPRHQQRRQSMGSGQHAQPVPIPSPAPPPRPSEDRDWT